MAWRSGKEIGIKEEKRKGQVQGENKILLTGKRKQCSSIRGKWATKKNSKNNLEKKKRRHQSMRGP